MNLKLFREKELKLTQEEFANLLKEDISKIIEWEEKPEILTLLEIQKICHETGISIDLLLEYDKKIEVECLNPENTWEKMISLDDYLIKFLAITKEEMYREKGENYFTTLHRDVKNILKKPKIAVVGRSDTGKSTLINKLLGIDKIPVSWTPTTSTAIYIKHISDKPSFMKDDVWIFSNDIDNQKVWNENELFNKEYCEKLKIASGDISLLQDFSTRQGKNFLDNAGTAVVFINAPLLKNCDIVDLPGFGTEELKDDMITFDISRKADIIIYLSQANAFMRIEDMNYLKENIQGLPVIEEKTKNELIPLSNLFIVASQAQNINHGNERELSNILNTGYENFIKTLPENYWNKRKEKSGYTEEEYKKILGHRFFTYTTDIPRLSKDFNDNLKNIIEILPLIIKEKIKKYIAEHVKNNIKQIENKIENYKNIVNEYDSYINLLDEIEENEFSRKLGNEKNKNYILEKIKELGLKSKKEFIKKYLKITEIENISNLMENQKINNNKKEIDIFISRLMTKLQGEATFILENSLKILYQEIEKYFSNFNENLKVSISNKNIKINFDAKSKFIEILQDTGKYGIFGGIGGFLSGIGLVFVSELLGGLFILFSPVVLALGTISLLAAKIVKNWDWRKSIAKSIIKSFEEKNILKEFENIIENFWKKTEIEFSKIDNQLEKEWSTYIENLKNIIKNYNIEEISEELQRLERSKDILEKILL